MATLQPTSSSTAMVGAIIGSFFGGALLSFGGFFLYKWNKNKRRNEMFRQTHP
jgi:hypothetical protein